MIVIMVVMMMMVMKGGGDDYGGDDEGGGDDCNCQVMVEQGLASVLERRCGGGEHCCRFVSS